MTAVQQSRPAAVGEEPRGSAIEASRDIDGRSGSVTNALIASSKTPEMSGGTGNRGGADTTARQGLMRVCAEASETDLETALAALGGAPLYKELRPPQTGLVMLRGRVGGSGPAFNLGEATVTRAVVRLQTGAVGYSYLLGGSHQRARLAALINALGQDAAFRARLESVLAEPVRARVDEERANTRAETAATRVDFFTLV